MPNGVTLRVGPSHLGGAEIATIAVFGSVVGTSVPNKKTGAEYEERSKGLFKPEEWNKLRVVCKGPSIKTYVNGKLVARGEVVLVDDVYGLRVTQIVDAAGRLDSLR